MSEVENLISSFSETENSAPIENSVETEAVQENEASAEEEGHNPESDANEDNASQEHREWDEKRARNRISRQDKRIDKLTWEKHQLSQKLAELQAQLTPSEKSQNNSATLSSDGMPKEDDYVGRFDEYLVAKAAWHAEQTAKSTFEKHKQEQVIQTQQQQNLKQFSEMVNKADKAAVDFIKQNPDAATAQQEFDELDLSPHAAMAVINLGENAPKAVYQLWKAGKLDELESSNPMQTQILLASALATPFVKSVTKAPTPVKSARGTTSTAINPENYSPDELLKLIRKR